jgi:predicted RNase H-like HicB family nuclease
MWREYIKAAMRAAKYEILPDGTYYGEIPGFKGVYADNKNWEDCRNELKSVLEEWVLFQLWEGKPVPFVDGLDISFKKEKE